MKAKVNKLDENSTNKNIWEMHKGINECKKGYKPRAYALKKENRKWQIQLAYEIDGNNSIVIY